MLVLYFLSVLSSRNPENNKISKFVESLNLLLSLLFAISQKWLNFDRKNILIGLKNQSYDPEIAEKMEE